MAILSHLRSKDPSAGYVTDFPELVERLVPILKEQPELADRHQCRRARTRRRAPCDAPCPRAG